MVARECYENAPVVDCKNINNWLVLFKLYLSQRYGQNKILEMRVRLDESESERQLRFKKYGPINQPIRKKMEKVTGSHKQVFGLKTGFNSYGSIST